MDTIKALSTKTYRTKQKTNTRICKNLNFEIKKTQEMLSKMYSKRHKRKKYFTRTQASDFLAQTYRKQRYKLEKNG